MRTILTFILIISVVFAYAQDTAEVRTYGGPYNDYGADMVETPDGGYAILGTTGSYVSGQSNMYLLKINSALEKEWSTVFGGANIEWGTAIALVDDGFLLLGYSNSTANGDYDIYLVKCDGDGTLIWEKTYGGSDWEFGYDLLVTENRIYVAGESWSFTNGQSDGYLLELDSDGNELWTGHFGGEDKDTFYDLFVGQNEIVAVGTEGFGTEESRIMLISLSSESTYETNFIDPVEQGTEGYSGMLHSNGDYYFAGAINTENTVRYGIFRTDSEFQGIPLFGDDLGLANTTNRAYTLIENSGQNLILVGESDSFTGSVGAYLVQLVAAGWFVSGPTFGGSATDIARKLLINSAQELLMVGETNSFGTGNYDVYLVKFPGDSIVSNYVLQEEFVFDQLLTDIEELESEETEQVLLAPNPARDYTIVQAGSEWSEYALFDLTGHLVEKRSLNGNYGRIDLREINSGTYILQLDKENSKQTARTKLIVQ